MRKDGDHACRNDEGSEREDDSVWACFTPARRVGGIGQTHSWIFRIVSIVDRHRRSSARKRGLSWRSMRLSSPWRKVLLTVHVMATVSVLGADLALLALGFAGLSGADPLTTYPAAHLVSARLMAPLALLALSTGLLQGILTPWGLFRYWWVTIKLTVTIILTGVVFFVLVPGLDAAATSVSGPTPHLLSSGERLPFVIGPAVSSALLALNVVLAIFKPGWRVRRSTVGSAGLSADPIVSNSRMPSITARRSPGS
jgi:hypothetical protein